MLLRKLIKAKHRDVPKDRPPRDDVTTQPYTDYNPLTWRDRFGVHVLASRTALRSYARRASGYRFSSRWMARMARHRRRRS